MENTEFPLAINSDSAGAASLLEGVTEDAINADLFLAQAERLIAEVKPLFAEKPSAVLGVALAELVAEFLAGMRPDRRA